MAGRPGTVKTSAAFLPILIAFYAALVVAASIAVNRWAALSLDPSHPRGVVTSVWRGGELVARAVSNDAAEHDPAIDDAVGMPDSELVVESILGEGPLLTHPPLALAISLVSGHDGV